MEMMVNGMLIEKKQRVTPWHLLTGSCQLMTCTTSRGDVVTNNKQEMAMNMMGETTEMRMQDRLASRKPLTDPGQLMTCVTNRGQNS